MRSTLEAVAEAAPATRVRYQVAGFAIVLGMITYLDRVCISTLAPDIMRDLDLTKDQMSYVFSAFALSYAAFGIPSAAWADRVGTRRALTLIVAWWSSFTMLTAAGVNLVSMLVIRFLFGAGEAGAWPAVARTFSLWIPYRERGKIQGIFFIGAHLAGGLTPLAVMALVSWLDWRMIFVVFGLLGFAWAAAWYVWFRDHPADHPRVNAAELADILAAGELTARGGALREEPSTRQAAPRFWRLLAQRNLLALCLMYLPNSFAFYFCITWLPAYLHEKHGLEAASLGIFAGLPLVLSVVADLLGGVTTDWTVRRFGPRWGRAGVGFVSYLLAAAGMLLATVAGGSWMAATWIALGTAASMFMLAAAWGTCQDIGGNHTGVVSATMNTAGQIGSLACPIVVIRLVEHFGDWNAALVLLGGLFLLGACCWCVIDPCKPAFNCSKIDAN